MVIFIVLLVSTCVFGNAYTSSTEFSKLTPIIKTETEFKREAIVGKKQYKIPIFEGFRYPILSSLYGVTALYFPVKVLDINVGSPDYFEVKRDGNIVYIRSTRPNNPEIRDEDLIGKFTSVCHVKLADNRSVLLKLEIASQWSENERVEFLNPREEELRTETQLKQKLDRANQSIVDGLTREQKLHFNDFKVVPINKRKQYKDTVIEWETMTKTDDWVYLNFSMDSKDLMPIVTSDVIFKSEVVHKGLIEALGDEKTHPNPNQIIMYPLSQTGKQYMTIAFSSHAIPDAFNATVIFKQGIITFKERIEWQDRDYIDTHFGDTF